MTAESSAAYEYRTSAPDVQASPDEPAGLLLDPRAPRMPFPDELPGDHYVYPCIDDPEIFFSPNHFERKAEKIAREDAARKICRSCFAQDICLEYALDTEQKLGIWGGLNEHERKRLSRERAKFELKT